MGGSIDWFLQLIDCLIDWLVGYIKWLIDWMCRYNRWLIDWLNGRHIDSVIDWLVEFSADRLVDWFLPPPSLPPIWLLVCLLARSPLAHRVVLLRAVRDRPFRWRAFHSIQASAGRGTPCTLCFTVFHAALSVLEGHLYTVLIFARGGGGSPHTSIPQLLLV